MLVSFSTALSLISIHVQLCALGNAVSTSVSEKLENWFLSFRYVYVVEPKPFCE